MSAVAQCKACLRALDLMLADNLTAAEADSHTVKALCVVQGLQLSEDLPRSTLKKLVLELKVPYHLGVAYSRLPLTSPLSDAACAMLAALDKVFSCLNVDPASTTYSSSLETAIQQQLLRSGLVQHMPALLEAAATRLEALAGAAAAAAAASAGPSFGSAQQGHSRSRGGDSFVATSCRDDCDTIVRVTQALDVVVHVVAFIAHDASSQQLHPHLPMLAASVLHLARAAYQFCSSKVQHLKQQQQQQLGTQLAPVMCQLHLAIRSALHSIVWVMHCYKGEYRQRPPDTDVLLQSPHSLPCLAAAITLECAALEARQQDVAPQWSEDPSAAALHYWQQSCRTAASPGVAARWMQHALGLEPQAVQFAVLCVQVETDFTTLQDFLSLLYLLVVLHQQQQQQQQAAMQPRVQCGQQGLQQLQWLLLVPAAVAQLTAVLVQQVTPEVYRFIAGAAGTCYTFFKRWVAAAPQVQQSASQLLHALSQQQGTALPCVLPAWYVDLVLPPLLSTATYLQQALQAEAGDTAAAAAAGASRANQGLALQAFSAVGNLLCCCLHHAVAVSSAPGTEMAGTAAAAVRVLGSSSSSRSSPAVNPAACEAWADLSAPLTQVDNADLLPPGSQVVIPHAVAVHVEQVMRVLTALVRASPELPRAAADPTGDRPPVKLGLLHPNVLLAIGRLCEGRGPEYTRRTPLLRVLMGAAGSCQGVAEQQLQGLLVSMLKLSAATAAGQLAAASEDVQRATTACHDAALTAAAAELDAVSQQLMQVTQGHGGGGGGGGGGPAAEGCTEVAPADMVQEGAAASSAASCANIIRKLPYLAVIGRWSVQWSQVLQQKVGALAEAHSTPAAAAAASSLGSSLTLSRDFRVWELRGWLSACRAVAAWLDSNNHTAWLRKAGYNLEPFQQAYLRVADMGAENQADRQPVAAVYQPELAQQLAVVGQVLTSLATLVMCNNPVCTNLSGPSEQQLVSGHSCICAGCRMARYCSRACQTRHWKQHKNVCKALAAAAAAAAGTAPATAAAPAAS